jgi:hypothetical protein
MKHNPGMGLLQRLFGTSAARREGGGPLTSQFHESETSSSDSHTSRNAPRRELIQVILRDTMRKHGIPSDWIECRILSTVSRGGRPGLHVNFVVRQAHDQLLNYVFAFQDSFERELARFEPRYGDWMLSIAWEFQGHGGAQPAAMPDPGSWSRSPTPAPSRPLLADPPSRESMEADARAFAPTDNPMVRDSPKTEDDVQRDLQALFAIRDAAMAQAARKGPDDDRPDFEPTRPLEDDPEPPKPRR